MGHIRVDLTNTNKKWVGFGLANVDTFIIRIGFGLANVDTIHTLTRHEHDPWTRIATPKHNAACKNSLVKIKVVASILQKDKNQPNDCTQDNTIQGDKESPPNGTFTGQVYSNSA